jgi:hypothetical protein
MARVGNRNNRAVNGASALDILVHQMKQLGLSAQFLEGRHLTLPSRIEHAAYMVHGHLEQLYVGGSGRVGSGDSKKKISVP